MSPDTIATIISVSIVVLAIAIIVTVIVSKIRHLSRTLFGTSSLIEGIQGVKEDQEQMRETPRSLHGMTSVYMPMIKKDFPEPLGPKMNLLRFVIIPRFIGRSEISKWIGFPVRRSAILIPNGEGELW